LHSYVVLLLSTVAAGVLKGDGHEMRAATAAHTVSAISA